MAQNAKGPFTLFRPNFEKSYRCRAVYSLMCSSDREILLFNVFDHFLDNLVYYVIYVASTLECDYKGNKNNPNPWIRILCNWLR
uniref:Uncharacterized protein n=1 Tax=Romanomermis culicivorax TaxID=13658 RepID=A0A915KG05_ROMCU